jgi:hypothetical protein
MDPLRDTRTWRLDPVPQPRWWEMPLFALEVAAVFAAGFFAPVVFSFVFLLAEELGLN